MGGWYRSRDSCMQDPWLPRSKDCFVHRTCLEGMEDLIVSELLSKDGLNWNSDMVRRLSVKEEVELILSIPLSFRRMQTDLFGGPRETVTIQSGLLTIYCMTTLHHICKTERKCGPMCGSWKSHQMLSTLHGTCCIGPCPRNRSYNQKAFSFRLVAQGVDRKRPSRIFLLTAVKP